MIGATTTPPAARVIDGVIKKFPKCSLCTNKQNGTIALGLNKILFVGKV
jgi:hypothetical protein